LSIPSLKVIWGKKGIINTFGDVKGIWKGYCADNVDLTAEALDCGHYIAEERPEELLNILGDYL
jgi:haloacetate dehalogenase